MNFKDYLTIEAEKIDSEMESFYKVWRKDVGKINGKLLPLLDLAIDASRGGKRIRGVLVKLGYEIVRGNASSGVDGLSEEIYKPAVAYEIFQTAILAHDDIIDKSPTRRGKPTIYASLGSNHYATSQTICLGDIGFFLAFQILSNSNFDPENKSKAISIFAKSMLDTGFGQMLDVELPSHKDKKLADIITISKYKTAWYTVVGPLQLGATLGGANQKLLDNLKAFGENLGIAFQIQDDILGIFGEAKELGKSVTSDIEEGKLTLLYLKALESGNSKQVGYLKKNYGQGTINNDQLTMIREIFIQTGALKYAEEKAEVYASEAKKIIPKITKSTNHKKLLNELCGALIKRNR